MEAESLSQRRLGELSRAAQGKRREGNSPCRQPNGMSANRRAVNNWIARASGTASGSSAVSVSVFDGFRFLSADPSGRERTRENCGGSACCCYPLRLRPEIVLSRYLVGGNLGGNGRP